MTDLQPTGLAFERLKISFSLVTSLLILVNHKPLGDNKATCAILQDK